ncbi:MAG: NHL repeat-containing protein [Planctomycetes bacterium]|nr:NHL repeat-containing protein [Planctomycetota bacterium]
MLRVNLRLAFAGIFSLLAVFAVGPSRQDSVRAGDDGKAKPGTHLHKPVQIVGDPIVERIRLPLQRPRRVLIDSKGNRIIADSGAGKVFLITPGGSVRTLADRLNEPSGLAFDQAGNLFVSNHALGEKDAGSIIRITPEGKTSVFVQKLTGPKGLAFDAQGRLYVALFDMNRIIRVDKTGKISQFSQAVSTPAGLAFDRKGFLWAVNSLDGTAVRLSADGKAKIVARGFKIPSDIVIGPEGDLIVTNLAGKTLSRLSANGKSRPYLAVPEGTIGLAFAADGNLVIVNWNLQMAVKITTRLTLPCPHCGKKIPLIIRPKRIKPKSAKPII